ncbi:hypothetical protein [Streptomyces sp. BH105]|uniref:hypothetical protein n=1 Tax=Streptomyces sp. BH105 TaxID=3410408 RepID=UPI003CF30704
MVERQQWTIVVVDRYTPAGDPIVWTDRGESPVDVFECSLPKYYEDRDGNTLPGVDTGLARSSMLTELHGQYAMVAAFKGEHQSVQLDEGTPADAADLSEETACDLLEARLASIGVEAKSVSTGGGCYAVHIRLNDRDQLFVTPWPDWCWSLEKDEQQILSGHWGTSEIPVVAKRLKKLLKGLGTIVP